jgi:hypothetical protein
MDHSLLGTTGASRLHKSMRWATLGHASSAPFLSLYSLSLSLSLSLSPSLSLLLCVLLSHYFYFSIKSGQP